MTKLSLTAIVLMALTAVHAIAVCKETTNNLNSDQLGSAVRHARRGWPTDLRRLLYHRLPPLAQGLHYFYSALPPLSFPTLAGDFAATTLGKMSLYLGYLYRCIKFKNKFCKRTRAFIERGRRHFQFYDR